MMGCFAKNKGTEQSQINVQTKRLYIPNDLNKNSIDNYYPIPDIGNVPANNKVSIVPPGSGIKGN